jgi:L-fuconolactonase
MPDELSKPARIVDAHIHLWDPARTDWYPYIKAIAGQGPGDPSRMDRLFDLEAYKSETAGWNVEKVVNVAAATGSSSIDETIELDARSDSGAGPDAIVGGLPRAETVAEAIEFLDRQMVASRFRGVRPMGGMETPLPDPAVLAALEERDLLFELMAHPDKLHEAAHGLRELTGLGVVVEHTGWPRNDSAEELRLWKGGIDALADIGGNVACKLSGLAMPLGSMTLDALRPWLEYAIGAFGEDRCMFASNFPVDAKAGTFDDLYATFTQVAAGLDSTARDKLFAANAERIYRC